MNDKTIIFSSKLNDRYDNEYTILGEYINQTTKILVKHNKCNKEFEIVPKAFISKRSKGCNYCRIQSRIKSNDTFKKEIHNLVGDEYTLLSKYEYSDKKVLIKHEICDHEYEVTPTKFLAGRRCPKCFGKNKKTTESWKNEIYALTGEEYSLMDEYINNRTKILMKHEICGYEWKITPWNFKKGHRCPKCSQEEVAHKLALDHKEFEERFNSLNEDDYKIIGRYKNSQFKIEFRHLICNKTFLMSPSNFMRGNRCPHCKPISKGEQRIKTWLEQQNIDFSKEYCFDNLRGQKNKPLRYDFAIFDNNTLKLLIEYDGRQHFIYEESSMFSKEDFNATQQRDKEKNQYCIDNDITLIRINYLNYNNIENILNSVILEEDSETIRKFAIHIASE